MSKFKIATGDDALKSGFLYSRSSDTKEIKKIASSVDFQVGLTNASKDLTVTGDLIALGGISGSLTRLSDDSSYLVAGSNITITSASNGQITISSTAGGGGSGDVVGPSSATDNAIVRFDSTTGKLIQDSAVTIADTTGNITTPGDIAVNGGDITTTAGTATLFNTTATTLNVGGAATSITMGDSTTATTTVRGGTLVGNTATQNLFNTTATTLNIGGAATTLTLGASTGTATINNATVTLANATTINVNGANPTIAGTSTGTLTLFNTNLATVNAFGAATSLTIGNTTSGATYNFGTGTTSATALKTVNLGTGGAAGSTTNINIGSSNGGTTTINSAATVSDDLAVNGGDITTTAATFNLVNAATTINLGSTAVNRSINIGTAGNNTIVVGNGGTTTTTISGGTSLNLYSNGGTINLDSSGTGGTVNIDNFGYNSTVNVGTGAAVKTVSVGSTNSTSATTINAGTGNIDIGTSNSIRTINVGSLSTAANTINLLPGATSALGAVNIALTSSFYNKVRIADGSSGTGHEVYINTGDDGGIANPITTASPSGFAVTKIGTLSDESRVTIGSTTGTSFTKIQGGTVGITLSGSGGSTVITGSSTTYTDAAIGAWEIGSLPATQGAFPNAYAFVGHKDLDHSSDGNYALVQSNLGDTFLGAVSTRDIYFKNGTDIVGTLSNDTVSFTGKTSTATTTTIGNSTGASSTTILAGTGNIILTGSAASTYRIGGETTTGTITIGRSSATNTIEIGDGAIANGEQQTIDICAANITNNTSAYRIINIGTGTGGGASGVANFTTQNRVLVGKVQSGVGFTAVALQGDYIWIGKDGATNPTSSLIGFFGATPVGRQTGGAATADLAYSSNERDMINNMYTALRNYGLLT